jgi:hypothetical protein
MDGFSVDYADCRRMRLDENNEGQHKIARASQAVKTVEV